MVYMILLGHSQGKLKENDLDSREAKDLVKVTVKGFDEHGRFSFKL